MVVAVLLTGGKPCIGPAAAGIAGGVYKRLSDQHYIAAVEGGTGNRVIYGDPETIGLRFHKKF